MASTAKGGPMKRRIRSFLIHQWPVRFLIDFYTAPRTALRRYSMKRTWPTRKDFDAMTNNEFAAYLRKIGMLPR